MMTVAVCPRDSPVQPSADCRLSDFSVANNARLCGPFKELLNERAGMHPVHGTGLEWPCEQPDDEYYDPEEYYADEL